MTMAAVVGAKPRLDIGEIFQKSIGVLKADFGRYAVSSLVLIGIPSVIVGVCQVYKKAHPDLTVVIGILSIVSLVTNVLFQGSAIYGAVRQLNGEPASLQECLRSGNKSLARLIGLDIISGLMIGVGFLLLVVPGVLLALRWSVAGPALVMSARGANDAMEKSVTLTEGRRGGIFLIYLILWAVMLLGLLAMTVVAALFGKEDTMSNVVFSPLFSVIFAVANAIVTSVLYIELTGAPDAVAAVFE